jgi:hypothetical protein
MLKSVEGVYRDGKIELTELPEDVREEARVIVTFLETSHIDLRERGIDEAQAAAREYAKLGVRVNVVCPGFTRTPMADELLHSDPTLQEKIAALYPMGRLGTSEEVAEAVVWLCSDAASFTTGHALPLDGGLLV